MPDQPPLEGVVQRMIDAGESEDNIATVIQHYKANATPAPTASDMLSRRSATSDSPDAPDWKANAVSALTPLAHPQTAGDMAGLLIPSALGMGSALGNLKDFGARSVNALKSAGQETTSARRALSLPFRAIGKFNEALPSNNQLSKIDRYLPNTSSVPDNGIPQGEMPTTSPSVTSTGLSAEELASLKKQGYSPETITRMTTRGTITPLRPVASHTPSPMPDVQPTAPVSTAADVHVPPKLQGMSELQPARLDIGAERVGRPLNMTKGDVRMAAGPRLDEARGTASPILPDRALGQIVDTLKSMPPGSPERAAYVARATSGKTQWQVENIRRTLEHLGLVAPLAIAPAVMHRQTLIDGLNQ